jgi:hypothetical protein
MEGKLVKMGVMLELTHAHIHFDMFTFKAIP